MAIVQPRVWIGLMIACLAIPAEAGVRIEKVPGQAELGTVEIHGVAAGPFNASLWDAKSHLGEPITVKLEPGSVYRIHLD